MLPHLLELAILQAAESDILPSLGDEVRERNAEALRRLDAAERMRRALPMLEDDARDAQLFATYARMRLTVRGRQAILSGLAGFNRNVTTER